jgi:hypothetical protein
MKLLTLIAITAGASFVAGAQPQVIVEGLHGPQKMILTRGGNFLVSETSTEPNSGRVSLVTRSGTRRTLLDHLPSGTDVTGGGSGPTAMTLHGQALAVAIGSGDAERRAAAPASVFNSAGMSSPLFSSVLVFDFNRDLDVLTGTFSLTPELQRRIADGFGVDLEDGSGGRVHVEQLAGFPNAVPDPQVTYRFSNPWGMIAERGTVYLTDASMNALVRIDPNTGRWRRILYFPPIPNPGRQGGPVVEAVPTSVRRWGRYLLVSLLTGFPFNPGESRVMLIDEKLNATPFITGLNSAVDVYVQETGGPRPIFYVLEFSQNQGATPPLPGRLLRYDTATPVVVSDKLTTPVSMVVDEIANTVYVLQLTGQILQIKM